MKNITLFLFLLIPLLVFAGANPVQQNDWTTNLAGALPRSTNVPTLNGNQAFTGILNATNDSNQISGTFYYQGSGLGIAINHYGIFWMAPGGLGNLFADGNGLYNTNGTKIMDGFTYFGAMNGSGLMAGSVADSALASTFLKTVPVGATNSFAAKAGTNLLDNGTGNLTPNGTNAILAQITAQNISLIGGITNGQFGVTLSGNHYGNHSGIYRGGNPTKDYWFGDSLSQNLRVNGWFSQGGFSNQYVQGNYTNGYLYYPVGAYATNTISIADTFTNILALQRGVYLQLDTAGAVPGTKGADIYGGYSSLDANLYYDQNSPGTITYNSGGTNSGLVHGEAFPLTFWPASTNDVYFIVQGTYYTNVGNSPISFTVTGGGYVSIIFKGTASFASQAKVTLPYYAGQGSSTKYSPPYTSPCDNFQFTNNIPGGIWALSNAPIVTGIAASATVSWGNNDTTLSTNAYAIWANQVAFANYLHTNGFYPVKLVGASSNPNFTSSLGLTMTNLINIQRSNWVASFDFYYDLQKTNENTAQIQQGTNYIDGTHWKTLFAGQNATNMFLAFGFNTLLPTSLAGGVGGINDGSGLTNINISTATGNLPATSPKTPTAVSLTGSVFTFSNATPSILECYFSGSVAYAVTKNGVGVFGSLAADGYFQLQPTNICAITYTVAPTFYTNSLY